MARFKPFGRADSEGGEPWVAVRAVIDNGFVLLIAVMVGVARMFPEWGGPESPLPVDLLRKAGVGVVFFSQGVLLPREHLRRGVLEWRLHAFVQGCIFVGVPFWMALGARGLSGLGLPPDLVSGFLYLGFLPTTVTSAAALTSLAGGNVTGALFNCSLSSVIGVFSVPVMCVAFLGVSGGDGGGGGHLLLTVALILLVPLGTGRMLRPRLAEGFTRHRTAVRRIQHGVILFMVWTAFCQSFQRGVWQDVAVAHLWISAGATLFFLFTVTGAVWVGAARVGLPRASRVTALFCGSQKSLAMGLPMAALLFAASPVEPGMLLLPLLLYHPAQLVLGAVLVPRLRGDAG